MRYTHKSFLLVIILISVLSSCSKKGCTDPMSLAYEVEAKKDDGSCTYPENVKRSLVFLKTWTGCPPCGTDGKLIHDSIESVYGNTAQVISLYTSALTCAEGIMIQNHLDNLFGQQGTPRFYLSTEQVMPNYWYVFDLITPQIMEQNQVSITSDFNINNGKMNIKVQSQLENGFSGENCNLALYVTEDKMVHSQSTDNGTDENFIHKDVFRIEAQGLEFGNSISFNDEGKNLTELELTLAPSTIWNYDNLHVNAVIWQFDGSNYKFINVSAD
tara:strand:- start:4666 stop:5481 length:816 start_codon:yes stop_codon:yes gene_type:complete